VSATTGEGIDLLRERLAGLAKERMVDVRVMIPYHRGDLIAAVHADGHNVIEETNATGMRVSAMLPVAAAGRIKAALAGEQSAD
jgi:GTP-binding protein HflX